MNVIKTAAKNRKRKNGKRGFTLVELCVVLFLIVLLSSMTATFSALVSKQTENLQSYYTFMEQCTMLRADVTDWLYDNITADEGFTVDDGILSVGDNAYEQTFSEIQEMIFTANDDGDLLKCTAVSVNGAEQTLVIAVRMAGGKTEGGA